MLARQESQLLSVTHGSSSLPPIPAVFCWTHFFFWSFAGFVLFHVLLLILG